ncbi:MAG: hypothetical protein P8Y58_14100 [Novosphingobium sp.]
MELSPEDAWRLNVLLANKPLAIRINESSMTVFGLSEQGEARVDLQPTCRDEQYIKRVKELISGHVLGSPGGYPVYLQRWTRMGQMKDDSLEQLLMLGEPEAVVAAVCAPGLTDELARRAWWAMEDAENARQMLRKQAVCEGGMGPVLASYLVEHLPFEAEAEKQIDTIRLVLQPGLLDVAQREDLWRKAGRKPPYYVGFIATLPDDIPDPQAPHPLIADHGAALSALAQQGNQVAESLQRVLDGAGQAWLQTLYRIFKKPSNQDVINITLDEIAAYFQALRGEPVDATLQELESGAEAWLDSDADARSVVAVSPQLRQPVLAMYVLSGLGYGAVRPVFKGTTAIGSLMRKKLAPVMEVLYRHLDALADRPGH